MLVLNRLKDETVTVFLPDGRQILIGINGYSQSKGVSLGFEAPKDVRIIRTEVMSRPDFVMSSTKK